MSEISARMNSLQNPYQVSDTPVDDQPPSTAGKTRWRLVPAILLGVLGAVGLMVGLTFAGLCLWNVALMSQDPGLREYILAESSRWSFLIFSPVLSLLWGVGWLLSARAVWRRRWRWGLAFFAGGTAALIAFINLPSPIGS